MSETLLLASQSTSRRRLLADAMVPFETVDAGVDEEALKAALDAEGMGARDLADALAEWKAKRPSMRHPTALVLGCDQTLELEDGSRLDKIDTREEAADLLARMSGRTHKLHSAAVIAQGGEPVWRQVESVTLQMRPLSAAFIDHYLDLDWENCRWCVGCYRVEGPGAQLFARIQGSLFAVQGLPLLPLLDYLRVRSILPA
ncbi:Maf family protein [Sphingobium nicotianae]|uniref:Nucleoside triphosphate pyrophosphatase n=1 Tax=Sphingobium nicotianae TaxID=2782607 RepID=A0A9X1DER3_9SPHN|nr:nucleoside triphosphate pyrophosphatase [Sphingobium nicotianae]MBT2188588.1 Maf family protein [Sphingobium nicotianae]